MTVVPQTEGERSHASSAPPILAPASNPILVCPACNHSAPGVTVERFGRYECFACGACDLHFWTPREMPDARWYERVYSGRDQTLLPLEPGHKYFLSDPLAPRRGELLDVGCGTGNFLVAARASGYQVSGTELDADAARFAREQAGVPHILPLSIVEFARQCPREKFDVLTFFEVLEHQAAPGEFMRGVRSCLRPRGYVALSVPNRGRWLTAPDVLDYPPNHFLRWNVRALKAFLSVHGFEILSVREQAAGIAHTAQMINMSLRTGLSRSVDGQTPASFREIIQMQPAELSATLQTKPSTGRRALEMLARIKYVACFPAAVAAYPYIRMRGRKGTYLYCLARRTD